MLKYLLFVFLVFFALQGVAAADFYTWEDENGTVHITNYPPPVQQGQKIKVQQRGETTRNISEEPNEEQEADQSLNDKNKASQNQEVVLYTTSWCPYCTKARNFFQSRNIPFTEYDVEKDPEAAARKRELDPKRGVPFAIINGHHIHGYSESAYEQALQ